METNFGKHTNQKLWQLANDSVNYWQQNKLRAWHIDTTTIAFKFDTLVCVNSAGNKLVMAHLGRQLTSRGKLDAVSYFYGVKIKTQWYFFSGPTLYVPRSDLSRPTPFAELHEQAVAHIFRAYLHKDASGQWRINDHFFADMTDENRNAAGFGPCFECQSFEEYALFRARANWISSFVPFTKQQVTYHYNPDSATLTLAIPLRKPPIPYVRPYQIAITYRQATQAFTGADYDQPFTRLDSTQQRYQAVLGPLNPHTDYLIRVMIHYSHFTRSEGTVHVELPYHSP